MGSIMNPEERPAPIYLDYQASTPLDSDALAGMRPWFEERFGNPHAQEHAFGWQAHAAIENARAQVGRIVNADADEMIFTASATEANNIALIGTCTETPAGQPATLLVSSIEHPSVLEPARMLSTHGYRLRQIPVDAGGLLRLDVLEQELKAGAHLVSVSAVNNEIGTVQDLARIGDLCRRHGALFHTDAAQALTALELDVKRLPVDLLTVASHKAYGPQGIGALYIAPHARPRIRALIHGGGQEQGLRSGTLPTALCVGFGRACEKLGRHGGAERDRVRGLRDDLWRRLTALIPTIRINGSMGARHPGNLNVRIPGIDARELVQLLQPAIACSTGSACHSGSHEHSHVLTAIGLSPCDARSSLRLSIGRFTNSVEVAAAAEQIAETLHGARALSA